jgi:hypothetical protein
LSLQGDIDKTAAKAAQLTASNIAEKALVSFLVGAIYAVRRASKWPFFNQNLDQSTFADKWYDDARKLAVRMSKGYRLPCRGNWLAGYFLNDVMFRIDVGFERSIRYRLKAKKNDDFKKLKSKAEEIGFPDQYLQLWGKLRNANFNRLKHRDPTEFIIHSLAETDLLEYLEALVETVSWVFEYRSKTN